MGFPNVDLHLVDIFLSGMREAQMNPKIVDDVFEDLDGQRRGQIKEYLASLAITDDVRQRKGDQRCLYILPNFPLAGFPFPQVGISLGPEEPTERGLSDHFGEPEPVRGADGEIIGYDIEKGYLAHGSWTCDVLAETKQEAVWLSRLCQMFTYRAQRYLADKGVMEVSAALADVKLEPQQAMQPHEIFARAMRVTAKVANTWKERVAPQGDYQTGINTALA